jgi:TM2 domain-containing membrane protein YozV
MTTPGPTRSPQPLCPFCLEPISASAYKCKHCGEFLDQTRQKFSERSRWVAVLLLITLGWLGAHSFYAGKPMEALRYVMCTIFAVIATYILFVIDGQTLPGYLRLASLVTLAASATVCAAMLIVDLTKLLKRSYVDSTGKLIRY